MNPKKEQYPNVSIYNRILRSQFLQRLRIMYWVIDAILIPLCDIANFISRFFTKDSCENRKENILIIMNIAVGDCVLFLSSANEYRKMFPQEKYNLCIACQKQNASLFEGVFDCIIPLDFVKGCVSIPARFKNYRPLRTRSFSTVIDPIGCADCTTNIFATNAAKGKVKIGILDNSIVKYSCPQRIRNAIYTKIYSIEEQNLHRILFYSKLPSLMQNKNLTAHVYTFPQFDSASVPNEKYFIVFPCASLKAKMWPMQKFAQITDRLYEQLGIKLCVCGTEKDRKDILEFLGFIDKDIPTINLIGQTSIKDFIEIIGGAECVLTNDTGAMHIAAAKNVPSFVIAGGFSYGRFTNYENIDCVKPVLICHKDDCFNCNNYCKFSFKENYPCIENISVDYAWSIIEPELMRIKQRFLNA